MTAPARSPFATRLGFGASGLGTLYRNVSDGEAQATLEAAYAAGMRYFDTAPLYGHGLSELRLGRFMRGVPRHDLTVSTKVGRTMVPPRGEAVDYGLWAEPLRLKPVFDYSYDGTMRSLEQSVNRLGFERIDVVYIHDVDRFTHGDTYRRMFDDAMAGAYRALDELRRNGHVAAIGVGVNESDVATAFLKAGHFDVVMMAGRYTLLDQAALADLLPTAERQGVQVVAAGIFNSGILAKATDTTQPLTFDYRAAPDDLVARVRRMVEICDDFGVPFQAAAIQFPFGHKSVVCAVLGMSRPERIAENLGWASVTIPDALWTALKAAGLLDAAAPVPAPGGLAWRRQQPS